jgi:hypothetical protein
VESSRRQERGGIPTQWEVVGLVRSDRLLFEAMRIAPSVLAGLLAGLLIAFCAWPLFKIWVSSTRERIHMSQAWAVGSGLAVAVAVFAFITVDLGLHWGQINLRRQLEGTADEIEDALEAQVAACLAQLETLKHRAQDVPLGDDDKGLAGSLFQGKDSSVPILDPHLKMVFWTDGEGEQVAKWAVQKPTPMIHVEQREYFQRVRDGMLWSAAPWQTGAFQPSDFFAERIRSWTTGEQEVIFSQSLGPPETVEWEGSGSSPVAAMADTKLPCMLRPILPPGRGFSVLGCDGTVVFHSQPERNGIESFVVECEGAPELKGSLFAGSRRHFTSRYRGRDHAMFIRPLEKLPWHIVVFQERELLQTVRFEALELALLLWLLLALIVMLPLLGIWWLTPDGTLGSYWPAPSDAAACVKTWAISALMTLVPLTTIAFLPSWRLGFSAGLLVPLAAITWIAAAAVSAPGDRHAQRETSAEPAEGAAVTPRKVGAGRRGILFGGGAIAAVSLLINEAWGGIRATWPVLIVHICLLAVAAAVVWAHSERGIMTVCRRYSERLSASTRFAATAAAVLVIMSAVPAAVLLWAACQSRLDLEVVRGQVRLAHALLDRQQKIEKEYRAYEEAADGGLVQRVLDDTDDVHYDHYFDTRFELVGDGLGGLSVGFESGHPSPNISLPPRTLFGYWPLTELYFFNEHSTEARGVDGSRSRETWWSWTGGSDCLVLAGSPPDRDLHIRISSPRPSLSLSSAGGGLAAAVLFGAAVISCLVFVGRRMYHVDLWGTETFLEDFKQSKLKRLLLVIPPGAELGQVFGPVSQRVNFACNADPEEGTQDERLPESLPDEGVLWLDHLQVAVGDASARAKWLPLLEDALNKSLSGLRIVAVSWGDPTEVLDAAQASQGHLGLGSDEEGILQRWHEVLGHFTQQWTVDAGDVPDGASEASDSRYRDLWYALGQPEQHLLAQIASGCLVNDSLREPLRHLLAWRLLERKGLVFRMKEDSFRSFVLAHYDAEALRQWEDKAAVGLWRYVRLPFYSMLGLILLFLFITQPGLFDITIALASVAVALLPSIIRIVDVFRRSPQTA